MSIVINGVMGKHLHWVVFFAEIHGRFQQLLLVLNVYLVCTEHYSWAQSCKPIYSCFLSPEGCKSLFHPSNQISLNSPKWLALHDCCKHIDIEKDNDNGLGFIWASCLKYWATNFCLGHLC